MDRNSILNDSETAVRYALDGRQAQMWTAMPAIVQSVNRTAMTCVCTPAIRGIQTNSDGSITYVTMPQLLDVPIVFPSAGGFSLTLPMKPGDEVLIVIANRCIDAWWQNGGFQNPVETRMHDLSDGFAIPGPRSQPRVVSNISSDNARLTNDAGTVYLEITPTGAINMVSPEGVTITGDLSVTGDIAGSNVSGTANVFASGVGLAAHYHDGVTPGVGDTGGPIS